MTFPNRPMPEYSTVIEAWFLADKDEDAAAIAKRLAERVLEHPSVIQVEGQQPEEQ